MDHCGRVQPDLPNNGDLVPMTRIIGGHRRWYLTILSLAAVPAAWLCIRPALAAVAKQRLLGFGAQVLSQTNGPIDAKARHWLINGQRVRAQFGTSPAVITELVEQRRRACAAENSASDNVKEFGLPESAFLSEDVGGEGFVVCLHLQPKASLWPSVVSSFDALWRDRNWDLVERFSYTYFTRRGHSTAFVNLDAKAINPFAMVAPKDNQDATPTADALPRPQGGRLGFSLMEEGRPYGFSVYTHGSLAPKQTLAQLRQELHASGFEVWTPQGELQQAAETHRMWWRRDDLWGVVVAFSDTHGTTTAFAASVGDSANAAANLFSLGGNE